MEIKNFKYLLALMSLCTGGVYADTKAEVKLENNSRNSVYLVVNRSSDIPSYRRDLEYISQKANSIPSQMKGVFTLTAKPGQSIYIYEVRNEKEVCRPENFSYPLTVHQGSERDQESSSVEKIKLLVKKSKSKNACKVTLK